MSDQVKNPEDQFSQNEAHVMAVGSSLARVACGASQVQLEGGQMVFLWDLFSHPLMIEMREKIAVKPQ